MSASISYGKDITITTTIKPLQSIVQNITGDLHNISVILEKSDSPHQVFLKPSTMNKMLKSDIIFYFDINFEQFLNKLITQNPEKFYSLVKNTSKLKLLSGINRSALNNLDQNDHGHHRHHHDIDYHLWLDIDNIIEITKTLENKLSELDPSNKLIYQQNSLVFIDKLIALNAHIESKLSKYKNFSYAAYHDAYQYFEKKYSLVFAGSILTNPNAMLLAKHLKELSQNIKQKDVRCIFSEPQFSPKIVRTISRSTKTPTIQLDVEWGQKQQNEVIADVYFNMMNNLTDNIIKCFNNK